MVDVEGIEQRIGGIAIEVRLARYLTEHLPGNLQSKRTLRSVSQIHIVGAVLRIVGGNAQWVVGEHGSELESGLAHGACHHGVWIGITIVCRIYFIR